MAEDTRDPWVITAGDSPAGGVASSTLNVQVIGAGFGRTGTLSLRVALERLGFAPCDHMTENLEHPERFALWREAFARKQAGQPIDWRPLLSGYRAIVDWPGAHFWRELSAALPEARVVLTVRDPERWYESCLATIFRPRAWVDRTPFAWLVQPVIGLGLPVIHQAIQVAEEVIWQGTFHGQFMDRAYALRVFADHLQEVRATIPSDRLLVFEVTQGWEPLCAFLGVPVPEGEPFPHVNDADSFRREVQRQLTGVAARAASVVFTATVLVAALVWLRNQCVKSPTRD